MKQQGIAIYSSECETVYVRPSLVYNELKIYNSRGVLIETINKNDDSHWIIKTLKYNLMTPEEKCAIKYNL